MDKKLLKEKILEKLGMIVGLTLILYILSARNGHIYGKNIFIVNIVGIFIIIILPNRILHRKVDLFDKRP